MTKRSVMAKKAIRRKLPTEHQTRTLRRIAQTGSMILTHQEGEEDRYADAAGNVIDVRTAQALIQSGWVKAEQDSMFDLAPQSWRVRSVFSEQQAG